MNPSPSTLRGLGLGFSVGERTIFQSLDLTVTTGTSSAIAGPSGSGKTTLLHMLCGVTSPQHGEVRWNEVRIEEIDDFASLVGLVLQGYGLIPYLTVEENIRLPLIARAVPASISDDAVGAMLERLHLSSVAQSLTEELSGGQKQRVAVARALVANPPIICADEPTAELDPDNRAIVVDLLMDRVDQGALLLLAAHDPEIIAACSQVLQIGDELTKP